MSQANTEENAKQIISQEIHKVCADPSTVKGNGCAACHVLYTLIDKMQVSESDASDLLSQILYHNPQLNEFFIEMVENVHMKQRVMGQSFSIKKRDVKDKYIDSNLKNVLAELSADIVNHGTDIVLRKLLISFIALEIAQTIGIDYHAATEELYYYMRKNDQESHSNILDFINRFYQRAMKNNKGLV